MLQAISCHYASSYCHYVDTQGTTQENISKEAEEIAKRKIGLESEITYQVSIEKIGD